MAQMLFLIKVCVKAYGGPVLRWEPWWDLELEEGTMNLQQCPKSAKGILPLLGPLKKVLPRVSTSEVEVSGSGEVGDKGKKKESTSVACFLQEATSSSGSIYSRQLLGIWIFNKESKASDQGTGIGVWELKFFPE